MQLLALLQLKQIFPLKIYLFLFLMLLLVQVGVIIMEFERLLLPHLIVIDG